MVVEADDVNESKSTFGELWVDLENKFEKIRFEWMYWFIRVFLVPLIFF